MVHVAQRFGERTEITYALPFSVDGMLVVAGVAMAHDHHHRVRPIARIAFTAGVYAPLGANVAAAQPASSPPGWTWPCCSSWTCWPARRHQPRSARPRNPSRHPRLRPPCRRCSRRRNLRPQTADSRRPRRPPPVQSGVAEHHCERQRPPLAGHRSEQHHQRYGRKVPAPSRQYRRARPATPMTPTQAGTPLTAASMFADLACTRGQERTSTESLKPFRMSHFSLSRTWQYWLVR
jgi:hypothetical protein